MAPLPKRKHSIASARTRTLAHALVLANLTPCPSCGKLVYSHKVCSYCGFYKGKAVVVKKEKKPKHEDKT